MRTAEQTAKIADMRKQVFAKTMSVTEFAFQISLMDGKCSSREEYNSQIVALMDEQHKFDRAMAIDGNG
jgi:exo-beta-1,3-glucanase (GH17 family)